MGDDWMPYEEYCDMVSENARAKHNVYLGSNEWKEKREIILKRDNYICQDCLKISHLILKELIKKITFLKDIKIDINIKASQVHHLNYDSLHTPQEINDCISLCEYCHKIKHSGLKYDYDKNVKKRNEHIERIFFLRLRKHPKIIQMEKEAHESYLKSITLKPKDWLKEQINEVENEKRNN